MSGGWDRKLLIWSLSSDGSSHYHDQLRKPPSGNKTPGDDTSDIHSNDVTKTPTSPHDNESDAMAACDGVVMCLEYCAKRSNVVTNCLLYFCSIFLTWVVFKYFFLLTAIKFYKICTFFFIFMFSYKVVFVCKFCKTA